MGLFRDTCTKCGAKVKKAAKFCSKCGTTPANGWWKCTNCKKWVGAGSEFCWSCKTPMHVESRGALEGGKWSREQGVFAERFEIADLTPLLTRGLTIDTGCSAMILSEGALKEVLGAGHYTLDSVASRISRWGTPSPKSVILMDSAEVGVPLRVNNLRTKEDLPVEFYGEVVFLFNPNQAESFIQNGLKAERKLTVDNVSEMLANEARFILSSHCQENTIEDLIKDPIRRLALEDRLIDELSQVLPSLGIELIRLGGCDFTGPDYEKLRAQSGELETTRRKLELDQRMRELVTSNTMGEMKSEADMEEYVAQLAQERDIGDEDRSHELNLLKQVHRHELDAVEVAETMKLEMEKVGHDIDIQVQWDGYNREKTIADATAAAGARAATFDQEAKETEQALLWRKQKNELKQQDLKAKADIYSGQSLETMIALVEDSQQRDQLLALHKQQLQAGISEKEIFAQAKLESLEEQKRMTTENADRLEGIMKDALKAMGNATKTENTIVK